MTSRDWTYLPFREMTWGERAQKAFAYLLASIIGVSLFTGGVYVLGGMADGLTARHDEHDHCLKQATNGYEIERCR